MSMTEQIIRIDVFEIVLANTDLCMYCWLPFYDWRLIRCL